jgi:signal transduction histidine kinase
MIGSALAHLRRYGVALLSVGLGCGVTVVLAAEHIASMILLIAVAASAYFGGLGPGLLATGLSAIWLDYRFFPPVGSVDLAAATWVWMGGYVGCAVLVSSFQAAQRRAMAALRLQDQRKSDFVGVLAHELRNFLSPVSAAVTAIELRGADDQVIAEACAIAEQQLGHMTQLINDLLDDARIVQGKTTLSLECVDLVSVLRNTVEAAWPAIQERGHRLEAVFPADALMLEGDPTRLQQIFLNLLTNAAKYTEPGGHIWMKATQADQEILVSVRDDGKGLSREALPQVFELFMQADGGRTGGVGIGLSLVRRLVELHGGSIEARSAGRGRGSEFVVRLPAKVRTAGRTERLNEVDSDGACAGTG